MTSNLADPIIGLLRQIETLIEKISDEQFTEAIPVLSNATLGQHTRHIIEFYLELINNYAHGELNYDARKRDQRIESEREFAIDQLAYIATHLDKQDKPLKITADYGDPVFTINTNYYRELMYNFEHTVHHMAILRIGVGALSPVALSNDFGVAASTIKYRKACAQ